MQGTAAWKSTATSCRRHHETVEVCKRADQPLLQISEKKHFAKETLISLEHFNTDYQDTPAANRCTGGERMCGLQDRLKLHSLRP